MGNKKEYNAADEEKVKDARQEEKTAEDEAAKDLKTILSTPSGVRFFRRLFEKGRIFQTSFTGNSSTFFNEGRRDFALSIFAEVIAAAPDKASELIMRGEKHG